MADREPRPSTDMETSPLLQDPEAPETQPPSNKTYVQKLTDEPLTPLAKLLLVVALILLMLCSTVFGLFLGAEHKLKVERGHSPVTSTITTTKTYVSTATPSPSPPSTVPPGAPGPAPTNAPQDICTSTECVVLAASVLGSLDTSKDPCEDFYLFSNGGWLDTHEIPAGKSIYGSFNRLAEGNQRIIRRILDESINAVSTADASPYDEITLTKLRGLYTSCMNEEYLDELGEKPLLDFVKVVRNLYNGKVLEAHEDGNQKPMTTETTKNGLTAAIAFLHSRGIGALFDFGIEGDVGTDPNAMTLWFSQPDLGLPSKEYYLEKDIIDIYTQTISRILYALDESEELMDSEAAADDGKNAAAVSVWPPWPWPPWGDDDDKDKPKNKTERARQLAKEVVEFESKIANASLDLEVLWQDPIGTYNPTSFSTFADSLPQIHFPTYLFTFTPRSFPETVILTSTTYALDLSTILSNTSSEVIEGYLVMRATLNLAPYLGYKSEVWKANRELQEVLSGIKKGQVPDRSDWCVGQVEESMGFAAGRFFVKEVFGGESRKKGTKVITDIIDAFKTSLQNLSWMDKKSANAAAEKADAIRVKVGYPMSPNTESDRSIAFYYNLVKIDNKTFFDNKVSAAASDAYKQWQLLGKRRDMDSWEMYPSMVNAYFNPPANEIVFPAGILQSPFFSKDWPAYFAYGAFGAVASHELTHAFDSAGRLYNQNGKLEQWWTNATSEGFQERQECLAKQYSSYYVLDDKGNKVYVNGNLTSGENIGDTGLIQAYRSWQKQFSSSLQAGDEYLLPGLEYTQKQLFFIAFGQVWGQLIKPQAAVQRVRTDPHSPNQFRVEGTLFNIPEFAEAFGCPKGSKLNPPSEKQCILW